jgi:hypothetical protein
VFLVVVALVLTGVAVYVGTSDRDTRETGGTLASNPSTSPPTTPLSQLDLSDLPIDRQPFCERLDQGDVEAALGGPVSSTYHYGNGDRKRIAPGVTDVSHEYNCTFTAADGTEARVWVFAEPVTRRVAASIARDSDREGGCTKVASAPTYGTPTSTTLCRQRAPDRTAVTLRGLFGDAWMSCELAVPGRAPAGETQRRGEQWCLRVATTLGARP